METRLAKRVNVSFKILSRIDEEAKQKFSLSIGNAFEVELFSISILGVSIFLGFFLPKGLRIELEIDGNPFGLNKTMRIKGEIRYCKQIAVSRYNCGVKFIGLPGVYKERIEGFVEGSLKRGR